MSKSFTLRHLSDCFPAIQSWFLIAYLPVKGVVNKKGHCLLNPLLRAQTDNLLYSLDATPCHRLNCKNTPKRRSHPWSSCFYSLWVAIFSQLYEFFMRFLKQSCVSYTQGNSQCEGCGATNDPLRVFKIILVEVEKTCILLLPFCLFLTPSFSTTQSVYQFLTQYGFLFVCISVSHLSLSCLPSHFKSIIIIQIEQQVSHMVSWISRLKKGFFVLFC